MQTMKAFIAAALVTSIIVAPHVFIEHLWQAAHPTPVSEPAQFSASHAGGQIEKSLIVAQWHGQHGPWMRKLAIALRQDASSKL